MFLFNGAALQTRELRAGVRQSGFALFQHLLTRPEGRYASLKARPPVLQIFSATCEARDCYGIFGTTKDRALIKTCLCNQFQKAVARVPFINFEVEIL